MTKKYKEKIKNLLFDSNVVICKDTDKLMDVGKILYKKNKKFAVVIDNSNKIIGKISVKDISLQKLLQTGISEFRNMSVKSVTNELLCITANCPIYYIIEIFVSKDVDFVCVVNNKNEKKISGCCTIDNVLKYLWNYIKENSKDNEKIKFLMNKKLKDANEEIYSFLNCKILKRSRMYKSNKSVINVVMSARDIDKGIGITENNKIIGVVNYEDINIYKLLLESKKQNVSIHTLKVKDIFNNNVLNVDENLKIHNVINTMINKGSNVFVKLQNEGIYRLDKEEVVKFLGKIYLQLSNKPSEYKYKYIFSVSPLMKEHKKSRKLLSRKTIPKFAMDIMTPNPITHHYLDTLADVGDSMVKNNINHIIITDEEKHPVGIVAGDDITIFKAIMAEGLEGIENTKIKDIMTREPCCAYTDAPIINLMSKMVECKIRCLPIVDHQQKVKGIITRGDIFKWIEDKIENSEEIKNKISSIKSKEIMNKDVYVCFENDLVIKKDKEMAKCRQKYSIVLDNKTKNVVGIVSTDEFVLPKLKKLKKLFGSMMNIKIGQVMNTDIWLADENTSLLDVFNVMAEKHLLVVPVVKKGVLVGQIEWWRVFEKLLLYIK